jgi:hypothetical protein
MTELPGLIDICNQPNQQLLAERRVDTGQVAPLPVGKTPEIIFEAQT